MSARRARGRARWWYTLGMIPPIPVLPGAAAAGVKATGRVAAAAIGRYRPAGVPRTGSREDRAAAYQRLLDAAVRAGADIYLFRHMRREGGRKAEQVLVAHLDRPWDSSTELICALDGVRLCGTAEVIAAAEALTSAVSDLEMNDDDDARFGERNRVLTRARAVMLDAARADLGYDTRPWQLVRRWKERRFLRAQQALAAREAAVPAGE